MTSWHELRSTALVGTERREAPAGALIGGHDPTDADPARMLLNSSALAGAARRAHVELLEVDAAQRAPRAPVDVDEVQAPHSTAKLLDLLLSGGVDGEGTDWLIGHWLHQSSAQSMVVPHARLPSVLTWATSNLPQRPAALEVLGVRGRWLASLNPAWAWVEVHDVSMLSEEAWIGATHAERMATVKSLRGSDPAAATALLEIDWPAGTAAQRADLVDALATGTGPHDESFLERCLDDRALAVRTRARELLAATSGSEFGRRMGEHLRALIETRPDGSFVLADPPDPDVDSARDGLGEPAGKPNSSLAQRRLAAIIEAAPLATWASAGVGPDECARTLPSALLGALGASIARECDRSWGRALLRRREHPAVVRALGADAHSVLAARLENLLRSKEASKTTVRRVWERHLVAVASASAPWSRELSDAVVEFMATGHLGGPGFQLVGEAIVGGLHPDTASRLDVLIARHGADRNTARALSRLGTLISLRTAIDEAFVEAARTHS